MRGRIRRSRDGQSGSGFLDNLKSFATSDFAKDKIYKPLANTAIDKITQKISGKGAFDALMGSKRGTGRRSKKARR